MTRSNNFDFRFGTVTVSGQPSMPWYQGGGTLTSTINSDLGSTPIASTVLSPALGQTDTDLIDSILAAQAAFPNNTYQYAAIPELSSNTYNSNSYVAWVLNRAGYNGPDMLGQFGNRVPGSRIVPPAGTLGNPPTFDQGVRAFRGGGGGGGGGADYTTYQPRGEWVSGGVIDINGVKSYTPGSFGGGGGPVFTSINAVYAYVHWGGSTESRIPRVNGY